MATTLAIAGLLVGLYGVWSGAYKIGWSRGWDAGFKSGKAIHVN